ncbi:CHAT domain-containing protein [Shimia gijangensis]|uniref:CHAT domain-containing protein n=1 Tax=Shimia gijangensis TaxID=1470563 RepID=A0A1M6BM67_9RHOB|nr:CHAT domain-containing protein [Shimia gijangensis]SHI49829.1 CHAT domain-containing protein [Shimia gijangensis]
MLKRVLQWAILGVGLQVTSGVAQEQAVPSVVADWQTTLSNLECSDYRLNEIEPDLLWAMASAFSGTSVVELAENAGFNELEDFFAKNGSINSFDNRWSLLQRIFEANPAATSRLHAEARQHGAALCPALSYVAKTGLQQVARLQINERAYWQPYSELAQILINAKNCGSVDVDGFFGPASRTAWGTSKVGLSAAGGTLPTPGDIAALADSTRACMPLKMNAFMFAMDRCHSDGGEVSYPELRKTVQAILSGNPDHGMATVRPALACVVNSLAWANAPAVDGIGMFADVVESIPMAESGWKAAQDHTQAVLGVLTNEDGQSLADAVGAELISRHGKGDLGLVGLALLANEPGGIRAKTLELVLQAGFAQSDARPVVEQLIKTELGQLNNVLTGAAYGAETRTFADGTLTLDSSLTMDQTAHVMGFITAIDTVPMIQNRLLNSPFDQMNYAYATFVLEGFTPGGRRPDLAFAHFKVAADRGHAPSLFRQALMTEHGLGTSADPDAAIALYGRAAAKKESAAALALAQRYETGQGVSADWERAANYYDTALNNMRPATAAVMVHGQMAAQTGFWDDRAPGGELLAKWAYSAMRELAVGDDGEPDWQESFARYRARRFAVALGHQFSDAESGLILDMHRAAQWLRVAEGMGFYWDPGRSYAGDDIDYDPDGSERLQRLVSMRPDLAAHPLETFAAQDPDSPEGVWAATRDVSKTQAKVHEVCAQTEEYQYSDCLTYLHRAAIGGVAPELVASAFEILMQGSDKELDEIRQFGRLRPDESKQLNGLGWDYNREPEHTARLVDVLAFFGDYKGAEARARLAKTAALDKSIGPLRRQVARARNLGQENTELESLLSVLARNGDTSARDLLESYRAPPRQAEPPDLGVARAQFAAVEHLPNSRAIANTARRLARAEAASGDVPRAIELELIAMKSDMGRHQASALSDGRMAAKLAEVCTLSRSSERLFGYGARAIAMTFAKQAVNTLQDMRRDISSLPEHVQLCFRAQVESHYRWLADLFIAENRPDEASRVLEMLKSFESFEFANRAKGLTGESYDKLPMMGQETKLIEAVERVKPAQNALSVRRIALMRLANSRDLSAQEQQELEGLNNTLAVAAEQREEIRVALVEAAEAVGRADANTRLNPGKSIKRYLRKGRDDVAAILQYVILPDRMGLVMTTASHQRVWGWDTLEGEPFDEARLNSLIADFRDQLRTPASDPRDLARRLNDVLLPAEVRAELKAAKAETLILSLDRQLRYLPVAALHDGENWLAAQFTLTHVNRAGLTASTEEHSTTVAAFGVTQAHQGFDPLPAVADEVNLLVSEGGGDKGILSGSARLDSAFTRDTFVNSLIFSDEIEDRMGIVHLASHFKFGTTEANSFLLLGNGGRLSVQEIREGLGQDADLSEVALLTLSACETAFGDTDADGRELESFAAIAQHQGARAVMASLWPVADSSTAALMVAFYQRYNAGLPVAEALRGAQIALMTNDPEAQGSSRRTFNLGEGEAAETMPELPAMDGWEHPFYWAPFILLEGSV